MGCRLCEAQGLVLMMHPQDRTAMIATGDGRTKELPFSAFLSAEIKEDGHAVTDTRRSGTLGRAAIGGVISGGTGAISHMHGLRSSVHAAAGVLGCLRGSSGLLVQF
ncbi:hypothetical protein [Yoonia sp. I 8.24]|uniref:hypothetical protein n=1 Tax=Yoonia sp. I 8.24 TaxID=1537229 RepID=UPI001EDD919F|nr:hypothetical protein [Yoonia sp. I 8.24]MCG3267354.1 hypothetical protein [Yoonia sp. I 8.24]